MKYALLVFLATWISVFTLGLQSLNVNQGHYFAAAVTSLGIGTGHIFLYKYMPAAGALEFLAYYAGGVTGITSSMWTHPRIRRWLQWRAIQRAAAPHIAMIHAEEAARKKPGWIGPLGLDEHADVANCGDCACTRRTDVH